MEGERGAEVAGSIKRKSRGDGTPFGVHVLFYSCVVLFFFGELRTRIASSSKRGKHRGGDGLGAYAVVRLYISRSMRCLTCSLDSTYALQVIVSMAPHL